MLTISPPGQLEGIGNLNDVMKRHFRTKLKNIFTKLTRKFGFELVKSMLPAEHHRVLGNIRKSEARTKRRKEAAAEQEDSDSEAEAPKPASASIEDILADSDSELSDDEGAGGSKGQKKKKGGKQQQAPKGRAWLKEGMADEPLNFLDPTESHGFKVTSDGRLIIKDDDDEEDDVKKDAEDEMKDILEEAGVRTKKTQKRKFDDDLDEDMETTDVKTKYKGNRRFWHPQTTGWQQRVRSGVQVKGESHENLSIQTNKALQSIPDRLVFHLFILQKGKGDVKKTGKVDPYAYIPLRKAQLNRRKRAKLQGQFKGMVRGAQKGAKSGKKMQRNKRRA
ncbi:hypothetical protein CRUP_017240 [Coryphaenoides rupestris]|nr:hypothetical protein CRUP_017240 [Coryphaenoides rupestris]